MMDGLPCKLWRAPYPNSCMSAAGQDRALRLFSVIQDQQSRELSQRHVQRRAKRLRVDPEELKLPQLTAVAACQVSSLTTASNASYINKQSPGLSSQPAQGHIFAK